MATKVVSHERGSFLTDVKEIRRRARQQIMEGAVTSDYRGDRETVVRALNQALATESVCVLRYKRHHYMAKGIHTLRPLRRNFLNTPMRNRDTPIKSRRG